MKKPKLYYKNEKGRYMEYHEPTPVFEDNVYYRKVGKRYEPVSMIDAANGWSEGVYAVVKNVYGTGISSGFYLQKIFKAYRCGDIEKVSISKLAGMNKLANYLVSHWNDIKGDSIFEECASIVSILMNFEEDSK